MGDRPDFADVRGQDDALRSIALAVVQRRGVLMLGPTSSGRTMIARRCPALLGPLSDHERTWLEAEYGAIEMCPTRGITERPFRAPHHTISQAALASGQLAWGAVKPVSAACRCGQIVPTRSCLYHTLPKGPVPPVGEARLARFGVLFLDEVVEFRLTAIEALCHTLREMGDTAPVVIASSSRCPCGWNSGPWAPYARACLCSGATVARYMRGVEVMAAALGLDQVVDVRPVDLATMREPGTFTTESLRDYALQSTR